MAELRTLRGQVVNIVGIRTDLYRHSLNHFEPVSLKPHDLARVVGEKPELGQAQVCKDLGTDAIISRVRGKAEFLVGFNGVSALVL